MLAHPTQYKGRPVNNPEFIKMKNQKPKNEKWFVTLVNEMRNMPPFEDLSRVTKTLVVFAMLSPLIGTLIIILSK